ncbi:uncharacterized protein LOC117239027 [Bombus vosnesenskii]|uniref:Uncharacterized protein LOC117239027 n=1 Tax=Bombus vosnesenskii TaxID=207650 RepID=A0A6J3L3F4_9HYME|nr:uncharacterized protein LOC117239027 [Bombus vosnesenskii]
MREQTITKEEFWTFIAVIINMGTMPVANIQEYWSRHQASHIPFYSDTFTRDRFTQIFRMLHVRIVSAQGANSTTCLQLISGYLDYMNSKFLNYFITSEENIYIFPGFICGILPYYESLTTQTLIRPDLPVSTRIPLHLYIMLLNKIPRSQRHHMFTDRYYTSYILATELHKLKCYLTGAILINRKELPDGIKKLNLKKIPMTAYRMNNNLILAWKDKRIVTLLTNWHNAEMGIVERTFRHGTWTVVKEAIVIINITSSSWEKLIGLIISDNAASIKAAIRMLERPNITSDMCRSLVTCIKYSSTVTKDKLQRMQNLVNVPNQIDNRSDNKMEFYISNIQ